MRAKECRRSPIDANWVSLHTRSAMRQIVRGAGSVRSFASGTLPVFYGVQAERLHEGFRLNEAVATNTNPT